MAMEVKKLKPPSYKPALIHPEYTLKCTNVASTRQHNYNTALFILECCFCVHKSESMQLRPHAVEVNKAHEAQHVLGSCRRVSNLYFKFQASGCGYTYQGGRLVVTLPGWRETVSDSWLILWELRAEKKKNNSMLNETTSQELGRRPQHLRFSGCRYYYYNSPMGIYGHNGGGSRYSQ